MPERSEHYSFGSEYQHGWFSAIQKWTPAWGFTNKTDPHPFVQGLGDATLAWFWSLKRPPAKITDGLKTISCLIVLPVGDQASITHCSKIEALRVQRPDTPFNCLSLFLVMVCSTNFGSNWDRPSKDVLVKSFKLQTYPKQKMPRCVVMIRS